MTHSPLRVALAQCNFGVGDIAANAQKICQVMAYAQQGLQADLVIFSELSLTGYPLSDLVYRSDLHKRIAHHLAEICRAATQIEVVIGYPAKSHGNYYNRLAWIAKQNIVATYDKQILPNYGVFDEKRYFQPGSQTSCLVTCQGVRFALTICEDLWHKGPAHAAKQAGADILLSANASPFSCQKMAKRCDILHRCIQAVALPILYVNRVGGQDSLVFDGGSCVLDHTGHRVTAPVFFKEHIGLAALACNQHTGKIDLSPIKTTDACLRASPANIPITHQDANTAADRSDAPCSLLFTQDVPKPYLALFSKIDAYLKHVRPDARTEASRQQALYTTFKLSANQLAHIYKALVLGTHDYLYKNHITCVFLGLSGGIDSALTLAIATDALGTDDVHPVLMPSRYTTQASNDDALQQVKTLGITPITLSIEPVFQAFLDTLDPIWENVPPDITEENLQARTRGVQLMALANKKKALVLTTSNKSEISMGYGTLYGDMAGGFCVLKDVFKTVVYQLAHFRNAIAPQIPPNVLTKAPSAELKDHQKDSDSLPPYAILDSILARYIEQNHGFDEIIAAGFDPNTVKFVLNTVHKNEHKRQQAPHGVRISEGFLGQDWRYPVTSSFRYP